MKGFRYLAVLFLVLIPLLVSSGCGGSRRQARPSVKGKLLKVALVKGQYTYDARAGLIDFSLNGNQIRALLGSPWVVIGGRDVKLPENTVMSGHNILISSAVVNYLKNKSFVSNRHQKKKFLVMIDPGHGGKDPGAMGNGLKEKDVVLDVAKRVRKLLEKEGIKVLLTRDRDVFIPLKGRANKANKANVDVFVSIHANASRRGSAKGIEVYYVSEKVDDSTRAVVATENSALKFEDKDINANKEIKTIIWDMLYTHNRAQSKSLGNYISERLSRAIGTRNRGVKGAPFYVLKWTNCPAVLVEIGFITNAGEAGKLGSPKYRERIARSIFGGIISYLRRQ